MTTGEPWLLLTHHIPPTPAYLRAKVMRRINQLGAIALKRSAYLLPASDMALEDLQWLRQEIQDEGGDAWILEGRFVGGLTNEQIRERFRENRRGDYRILEQEARSLLARVTAGGEDGESFETERRRLRRRCDATRHIDFFAAEGREAVETLMTTIDRLTAPQPRGSGPGIRNLQARTWATRAGAKVDRMGSAWLIRRFIDPAATFVFVQPNEAPPKDALRFDMFEGEFTHQGHRCTFEVLLDHVDLSNDPGLAILAEIVHDLDLKDNLYQRPETAGVGALLQGIAARFEDDHRRLAESAPLFDTLHASLGRAPSEPEAEKR